MPIAYRVNTLPCYTNKGLGLGSKGIYTTQTLRRQACNYCAYKDVMTSFQIQNMRHTDEKPFDAGIPIYQISGQRFCYYGWGGVEKNYIRQLAMTFKNIPNNRWWSNRPASITTRSNDRLLHRYTKKPVNLRGMTSNALLSRSFINELQHTIAFLRPTQYLTTTSPQAIHCRSTKKKQSLV